MIFFKFDCGIVHLSLLWLDISEAGSIALASLRLSLFLHVAEMDNSGAASGQLNKTACGAVVAAAAPRR